MSERIDNPFEPRLGRIRSGGKMGRAKTYLSQISRSISRAGPSGGGRRYLPAQWARRTYGRRVIVKASVVRHSISSVKALREHLRYISRDSAVRSEDRGRLFSNKCNDVDEDDFADGAKTDRHHFRFIVSPEDASEMADLNPFVRDLVSQMERDLDTKLEWTAAIHDNTQHPHAHVVVRGKRDNGRDLVIPRAYISHGLRERAQDLVDLELGPQTRLEKDLKMARQVGAEHPTELDRRLKRQMSDSGEIDLASAALQYQSIHKARLQTLQRLGLAQKIRGSRWQIADGFDRTLKDMAERKDIIKQIHRSLSGAEDRTIQGETEITSTMTGAVLRKGMRGEAHDEPYMILDTLDGRAVLVQLPDGDQVEDVRTGMIVSVMPADPKPKPSDKNIDQIAGANSGIYSEELHSSADPRASASFIQAHIRRLEALRRNGIVERKSDGRWDVPNNYLERVREYQIGSGRPETKVESWASLNSQIDAPGLTWLDNAPDPHIQSRGFGSDVQTAKAQRQRHLVDAGVLQDVEDRLTPQMRQMLKRRGMDAAGHDLAAELGKTYHRLSANGRVDGIYSKTIVGPNGKFAVIERARSFTLAPWRSVLERGRGMQVSGLIKSRSISWTFGKQRGGR